MNWQQLKEHIYYEDGSLRDIYIRNASPAAWKRWIYFINKNYDVRFMIGEALSGPQIDPDVVTAHWKDPGQDHPSASILISGITMMTYFFSPDQIENDITPKEITCMEDHDQLLQYLKSVSNLLGRPVELTEESYGDSPKALLIVDGDRVSLTRH